MIRKLKPVAGGERTPAELSDTELVREQDRLIALKERTEEDDQRWEQVVTERRARLQRYAEAHPDALERAEFHGSGGDRGGSSDMPDNPFQRTAVDGALRTLERCVEHEGMSNPAATTMEQLARDHRDPSGLTARYLAAAGDEHYRSAFIKYLTHGDAMGMYLSREEHQAWMRTVAVQQERNSLERAALQTGSGAAGGFLLPIVIDPSVMLTSAGALNPIRDLARVITVPTTEWRGVSSAGVTVTYDAELAPVSDDTPTFAQPTIFTEKMQGWAEYSIEVGQDVSALTEELLTLFRDARDVLDATMFYSGSGTDQPFGIMAASGGLTTSQRVQTAGAGAFAYGDVYTLKQAVRSRDMSRSTFLFHPNRVDDIWRFVASGDTTDAPLFNADRTLLLGRPFREWTSVPTAVTTGTKIGLYGDWRACYTIIDRIGFSAEYVPHVFDQATARPKGARGLYVYLRTGAKVVVPEAGRYLEAL